MPKNILQKRKAMQNLADLKNVQLVDKDKAGKRDTVKNINAATYTRDRELKEKGFLDNYNGTYVPVSSDVTMWKGREVITQTMDRIFPRDSLFVSRKTGEHYLLVRPMVSQGILPIGNGQSVKQNINFFNILSIGNMSKFRKSLTQDLSDVCVLSAMSGVSINALNKMYDLDLVYIGSFQEVYAKKEDIEATRNSLATELLTLLAG